MTVFISHATAAECWKSGSIGTPLSNEAFSRTHFKPIGSEEIERVASLTALSRLEITYREALAFCKIDGKKIRDQGAARSSSQEIESLRQGLLASVSTPLHVLVPEAGMRGSAKGVFYHTCSANLAAGSFVRINDRIFITSPELTFIQMARLLPFHELIKFGYELCSTYAISTDGTTSYGRELPTTTVRAIKMYAENASGLPGAITARKALRHVANASGSPMETMLAMMLCLPVRLGGFGLPLPQMNYRINAQHNKKFSTGKRYYLCDLYWPDARLCIEYDSDLEHTGAKRIAQDAQRRNDLANQGITVIVATRQQVTNAKRLEQLARQAAKHLKKRIRGNRGWSALDKNALIRSLMSSKGVSRQIECNSQSSNQPQWQ